MDQNETSMSVFDDRRLDGAAALSRDFTLFWSGPNQIGEVASTSITQANKAVFSKAMADGFPGVVFSSVDFEREAIAFAISESFSVAEKSADGGVDLRQANKGDILGFDDFAIEFHEFESFLKYKQTTRSKTKKEMIRGYAKNNVPPMHKVCEGIEATRIEKCSLVDAIKKHEALPEKIRNLRDSMGSKKCPVAFASSNSLIRNVPPTQIWKGELLEGGDTFPLDSCLEIDYLSINGPVRRCIAQFDSPASLLVCPRENNSGDLISLIDYLRDGGEVSLLVLQVPSKDYIEEIEYELNYLLEAHIPIAVFCPQSHPNVAWEMFDRGFMTIDWGNGDCLKESFSELKLSKAQQNAVNSTVTIKVIQDDRGFSDVARAVQALGDKRAVFSEKSQESYLSLCELLFQALRQTEMIDQPRSQRLMVVAKASAERLKNDPAVDEDESELLDNALSSLAVIFAE